MYYNNLCEIYYCSNLSDLFPFTEIEPIIQYKLFGVLTIFLFFNIFNKYLNIRSNYLYLSILFFTSVFNLRCIYYFSKLSGSKELLYLLDFILYVYCFYNLIKNEFFYN